AGVNDAVVKGMFQRDMEIVQVQEVPDPKKLEQNLTVQLKDRNDLRPGWTELGVAKKKGQLLILTATQAVDAGVARKELLAKDMEGQQAINSVYVFYGISPGDVIVMRANWLDNLVLFLQHPATTSLLAIIAFLGLILEIKAPGTTVPIIVSAFCFLLLQIPLAWYLSGQVGWGAQGAFAAVPISESILAVISAVIFQRGRWKLVKV
ncbi:MAG TPA: hypothetical protein PL002_08305, partial [Flavobacteriales bacterium]|nr:hypothetical protein [Flavobacteriales bacterium]